MGSFRGQDPFEAAAAAFVGNLLTSSTVTDQEFADASGVLSTAQLIDLTVLVGYYRTLAQLMSVFAIGVPGGDTTPLGEHRHAH
jgi:4-carboxymuconolactone decarboxylase